MQLQLRRGTSLVKKPHRHALRCDATMKKAIFVKNTSAP
jgi:hypothetical protein